MNFAEFWKNLQANLKDGSNIKNWTAAKGYLGDEFKIIDVSSNCVEIESPNAKTIQPVRKSDFEVMFNNWDAYCSKELRRGNLTKLTRVFKIHYEHYQTS